MLKKGDFIELDYTGRIKDDKVVFDTTIEQVAKDSGIINPKYKYKPVIITLGEHQLLKGLDTALMGKQPGKYTIEIRAENAFGKKSAELLKLLPMKLFAKDNVKPFVGLEVNVDETLGIVRSVSGGRVIVDFNHPLSSHDLVYDVDIKRIVTDPLEKIKSLLEMMGMPFENIDVTDDKAEIATKTALPEEMTKGLSESIQKLVGLKKVSFKTETEVKKELKKEIKAEKKETEEKSSEPSKTKFLSAKGKPLSISSKKKEVKDGKKAETTEEKKEVQDKQKQPEHKVTEEKTEETTSKEKKDL